MIKSLQKKSAVVTAQEGSAKQLLIPLSSGMPTTTQLAALRTLALERINSIDRIALKAQLRVALPVAATLLMLLQVHAINSSIKRNEAVNREMYSKLAEIRDGVSSNRQMTGATVAAPVHSNQRPLSFDETPDYAPPSMFNEVKKQLDDVAARVQELEAQGYGGEANLMNVELQRHRRKLKAAMAPPSAGPNAYNVEPSEEWCAEELKTLKPLFAKAQEEKLSGTRSALAGTSFETLLCVTAAEARKDKHLIANALYAVKATPCEITELRALESDGNEITSVASTANDNNFYVKKGQLYWNNNEHNTERLQVPGQNAMLLSGGPSQNVLCVHRGGKLYKFDADSKTWAVIDEHDLPPVPFTFDNNEMMSLGRVSNGHIAYIHKYDNEGKLLESNPLSPAIEIPAGFEYTRLISAGSGHVALFENKSTAERVCAYIESDNRVMIMQPLPLVKKSLRISSSHPDTHS